MSGRGLGHDSYHSDGPAHPHDGVARARACARASRRVGVSYLSISHRRRMWSYTRSSPLVWETFPELTVEGCGRSLCQTEFFLCFCTRHVGQKVVSEAVFVVYLHMARFTHPHQFFRIVAGVMPVHTGAAAHMAIRVKTLWTFWMRNARSALLPIPFRTAFRTVGRCFHYRDTSTSSSRTISRTRSSDVTGTASGSGSGWMSSTAATTRSSSSSPKR